jgi:hypothetical protein
MNKIELGLFHDGADPTVIRTVLELGSPGETFPDRVILVIFNTAFDILNCKTVDRRIQIAG